MAEVTFKGKSFEVDDDGFLLKFEDWCPDWVEYVKDSEGITELIERIIWLPWCGRFQKALALN